MPSDPLIDRSLKAVHECLCELYDNADPSGDWEEIVDSQDFRDYTIPVSRYRSIVSTYREKLPQHLQDALSVVLVEYSPEVIEDEG